MLMLKYSETKFMVRDPDSQIAHEKKLENDKRDKTRRLLLQVMERPIKEKNAEPDILHKITVYG